MTDNFNWQDRLFISLLFIITWIYGDDNRDAILKKIEQPTIIQCFTKSTQDETSTIMHRIKCPEGVK